LFKNGGKLECFFLDKQIRGSKVAILSIGMWSEHKCQVATEKLDEISKISNEVMKKVRSVGGKVIHGSSTLVSHPEYKSLRSRIENLPNAQLIDHGMIAYPPVPIDDSDGGVVTKNSTFKRQNVKMNPHIEIDFENDVISGHNKEILNYLYHHKIELLLVCGTHTNMCVLDRMYGIKNIVRYGFPVVLIRDGHDSLHNPVMPPFTSREKTNEIMTEWMEEHFCPSVHSEDIIVMRTDRKIIYVDIDNTICEGLYENAIPRPDKIRQINDLYDYGHTIIYWTARGSVSNNDWLETTRKQLDSWGVKRHFFKTGKPNYDIFICDKTINITETIDLKSLTETEGK
jgi:hypothetical protein